MTRYTYHSAKKAVLSAVGALILYSMQVISAQAANVTLAWNQNPEPGVIGYRVYFGTNPTGYTQQLDVGNSTTGTVSGLTIGLTYFFAITAFNNLGIESPYSSEVSYTVPSQTPTPTPTPGSNPVSISGAIFYCSNPVPAPVPGVNLVLTGGGSGSIVSDGAGNYVFSSLPNGGNYIVTPSKARLAAGSAGISVVDVIAVQRHILNLTPIPTGCRLSAADANGDTVISTTDMIAIQRFSLGLSTGIANVGQYRFSPASRSYSGLVTNQPNQNYDAMVVGDVASGFVDGQEQNQPPARNGTVGEVALPQVAVDVSVSHFAVEVTTTNINAADNLVGFQGDFTFDERVIAFEDEPVQRAGLTDGNWNLTANVLEGTGPIRTLRVSAYAQDLLPLSGSGTLFQLKIIRVNDVPGSSTELNWVEGEKFRFLNGNLERDEPTEAAPGLVIIEHQDP